MYLDNNLKFSTDTIYKKQGQEQFYDDVLKGLTKKIKQLPSKYFYDKQGDQLFQQIMQNNDYYLTRCEMEILQQKTAEVARPFMFNNTSFDLIELGAGDATKTYHLLNYLVGQKTEFQYLPVDISPNILSVLKKKLTTKLPDLHISEFEGEYFEALEEISQQSSKQKVVMVLGANMCNMEVEDTYNFCIRLHHFLHPGDLVLIGFDLKKNPQIILNAYNDKQGLTREFNLNLLKRINRELDGNFDLHQFEHYQTYDPRTGACKSYLISLSKQKISIGNNTIYFEANEPVYMEISQKYSLAEIENLAQQTGFKIVQHSFDSKNWFADSIWEV